MSDVPEVQTATETDKPLYLFTISLLQMEFTKLQEMLKYSCCYAKNPSTSVESEHSTFDFLFEKKNESGT